MSTPPRGASPGTPWRAAVGTVVFTLLFPGTVAVYVPYALTRWQVRPPLLGWTGTRWLGAALVGVGLPVLLGFLVRFVREGRGTPAPIAPTERLVVGGLFRLVRNPGYLGVLALIVGQALVLGSLQLLVYALGVALAFHLFVVLYEEPTLRRQFGRDYAEYCRRVPRWVPRLPVPRGRGTPQN